MKYLVTSTTRFLHNHVTFAKLVEDTRLDEVLLEMPQLVVDVEETNKLNKLTKIFSISGVIDILGLGHGLGLMPPPLRFRTHLLASTHDFPDIKLNYARYPSLNNVLLLDS